VRVFVAASVLVALAAAVPSFAQGKSQEHRKSEPPSRSELAPAANAPATTVGGATPFAWIDDATLVEPGAASFAISMSRWSGGGTSEMDVPIVDFAIGLAPRLHLAATIPRVVGSADPSGAVGGVGTSYFGAKIAALDDAKRHLRLSVAPTLELLGRGVVDASANERRVHFGVPVSVEVARGAHRFSAGAGYFSRGVWFAGAGAGARAGQRTYVSASVSRSWARDPTSDLTIPARSRNEVSGGAAFELRTNISAFASIARTFATLDENGAGTSVSLGLSLFVPRTTP
jgi:hypothetical protein